MKYRLPGFGRVNRRVAMLLACLLVCPAGSGPVLAGDEEVEKAIFLFRDGNTLTASNAQSGQFFELELSAKEKLDEQFVANGVAVIVTNQRFAGVGTFSGGWNSLRRGPLVRRRYRQRMRRGRVLQGRRG